MLKYSMNFLLCMYANFLFSQDNDTTNNASYRIYQSFKVNMFPMAGGRVSLNYEFQLHPKVIKYSSVQMHLDFLGMITTNRNAYYEPKGYSGGLMYKRYITNDQHALGGAFLFLQGTVGYLSYYENFIFEDASNSKIYTLKKSDNHPFGLGLVGIGKQFVLHNRFSLEFSGAAGVYLGKSNKEQNSSWIMTPTESPFVFGFGKYPDLPIGGTATIKLGYVFGSKERKW